MHINERRFLLLFGIFVGTLMFSVFLAGVFSPVFMVIVHFTGFPMSALILIWCLGISGLVTLWAANKAPRSF